MRLCMAFLASIRSSRADGGHCDNLTQWPRIAVRPQGYTSADIVRCTRKGVRKG